MILSTIGYSFEGYTIIKYIDVISNPVVIGTGFLSSLGASFADLTGTRSSTYENKLEKAEKIALQGLKDKATRIGANAIIGIDFDITTLSNNIIAASVNGTAVEIEKNKGLSL